MRTKPPRVIERSLRQRCRRQILKRSRYQTRRQTRPREFADFESGVRRPLHGGGDEQPGRPPRCGYSRTRGHTRSAGNRGEGEGGGSSVVGRGEGGGHRPRRRGAIQARATEGGNLEGATGPDGRCRVPCAAIPHPRHSMEIRTWRSAIADLKTPPPGAPSGALGEGNPGWVWRCDAAIRAGIFLLCHLAGIEILITNRRKHGTGFGIFSQDTGTSQHRMARHDQSRVACVGWRSSDLPTAIAPRHPIRVTRLGSWHKARENAQLPFTATHRLRVARLGSRYEQINQNRPNQSRTDAASSAMDDATRTIEIERTINTQFGNTEHRTVG